MKSITNTTREAVSSPALGFLAALCPEVQEVQGQHELVASELLPTKMDRQRDAFEKLGFVFGAPVAGDNLFQEAKLPAGWTKRRTDHPMWSEIVDAQGRVRVSIFYKAAFYDREAFMRLASRYRIDASYDDGPISVEVKDGDKVIWTSEVVTCEPSKAYDTRQALRAQAATWLDENRPNHEDPILAWEAP